MGNVVAFHGLWYTNMGLIQYPIDHETLSTWVPCKTSCKIFIHMNFFGWLTPSRSSVKWGRTSPTSAPIAWFVYHGSFKISSKFQSPHDNISSQGTDKRRWNFGQWMNSCIIHDDICSNIQSKCHPKSCHIDINYHMTLNIIFGVVFLHVLQALSFHRDESQWIVEGSRPPHTIKPLTSWVHL